MALGEKEMNAGYRPSGLLTLLVLGGALFLFANNSSAQGIGELNAEISAAEGEIGAAESNPKTASAVIERLDRAEALFAKIANDPKSDKGGLVGSYGRLESMLNRMYTGYRNKKEACIEQASAGSECDYTEAEQLSLRALYPLSWLRYQAAASLFSADAGQARRLLNQAIDGFTESTLVIFDPNLVRENLLGRANCERELGKYDKAEYDKALKDFQAILKDGPGTQQYKAAQTGVATTLAAMGRMEDAAKMTGRMVQQGGAAANQGGMLMMRLQNLLKAASATRDTAKRQGYYNEALDAMKLQEGNKQNWPVVIAAVIQNVPNPAQEFAFRTDPFTKWVVAESLLAKKDKMGAAQAFLAAARTGKYPQGYKNAAGIYLDAKRWDMVEQIVGEMGRVGGADSQWAAYTKFSIPLAQWKQSGSKNTQLEDRWAQAAQGYLKSYPAGKDAGEVRFYFADRLQRQGKYVEAAKEFDQVGGSPLYSFLGTFRAAQNNYMALSAAGDSKQGAKLDTAQLRKETVDGLRQALKLAPAAQAASQGNQNVVRETKGNAIYMLAGMLEKDDKSDPKELMTLLQGYETNYPGMKEKFNDVAEWRIKAEDKLGQYAEVERDIKQILERAKGTTQASDFIKVLGLDLWRSGQMKLARGDQKGFQADAKLTALAYSYFADQVAQGIVPAKNLTGTLSILGQANQAEGNVAEAEKIFNMVVKADPGSPDASAGLARIAQGKKDYRNAVELWTTVESVSNESDDLWYEAKYNVAMIYLAQGRTMDGCVKFRGTRAEHPSLGSPEMLAKWNAAQRKYCLDGKGTN